MSRLEKYTDLHRYATRLAEDDLTEASDEAATVAFAIGQVTCAIGSTIQGVAERIHNSNDEPAKQMFYAGLSDITERLASIGEDVGVIAAPFADLREGDHEVDKPLREDANMFDDKHAETILFQAQQFIGEHLHEGRISE